MLATLAADAQDNAFIAFDLMLLSNKPYQRCCAGCLNLPLYCCHNNMTVTLFCFAAAAVVWDGIAAVSKSPLDNKSCLFKGLAGVMAVMKDTTREVGTWPADSAS
jgi:hypothetical protein